MGEFICDIVYQDNYALIPCPRPCWNWFMAGSGIVTCCLDYYFAIILPGIGKGQWLTNTGGVGSTHILTGYNYGKSIKIKKEDKYRLLPRSENMEFGCRGVHHTYIYIHKYTYLHTYILPHKVNLGIQSLQCLKTSSLKIYISVCKKCDCQWKTIGYK